MESLFYDGEQTVVIQRARSDEVVMVERLALILRLSAFVGLLADTILWIGNFDQFLNRDGWAWHADLYKKYGGGVRVEMPFGVSLRE